MDVSVIIVNYKNYSDTQICVESLLKSETSLDFEIIIVDNNSLNESFDVLKKLENEKIKVLKSDENNGYCAGNNIGIKFALENSNTKYIWILNPDTLVDKSAMQNLFNFQEKHDDCGILGCKLVYYPDTQYLQGLGGGMYGKNKFGALVPKPHLYHLQDSNMKLPEWVRVDLVIGASMFIKSTVFEKCGFMEERFYLYSDENEFCLRATKFVFNHYAISSATVYHKEGWRQNIQKLSAIYYTTRNSLFMTQMLFPKNIKNHLLMQNYFLLRRFVKGIFGQGFTEYRLTKKALHDFRHRIYGRVDLSKILSEMK